MRKLPLLFLSALLFISCEKEELEINQIVGEWKLSNIYLKATSAQDGPMEINEDMSAVDYTITFNSDGTYSVKLGEDAKQKLEEADWAEVGIGNNYSGTFEIIDGIVTMKYFDDENKQNITNKFSFKKISDSQFSLNMDRTSYLELVREQLEPSAAFLAAFGLTLDQLMKEIEADIKTFDFKVTYSKVK